LHFGEGKLLTLQASPMSVERRTKKRYRVFDLNQTVPLSARRQAA
jgi:hypothetical protein